MADDTLNMEETVQAAGEAAETTVEEVKVAGGDFVSALQALLREGAVRKITVKDKTGRTLLEFPLYAGVIGAFVVGSWTVVALVAAWFAEVSILIERDIESDGHVPAVSGELLEKAAGTVRSTTQVATGTVKTATTTVSGTIAGVAHSASDLAKRAADSLEGRLQSSGAVKEEVVEMGEELEAAVEPQQCVALTKAGTRCKRTALPGSDYCSTHQPLAN